MSHRHTMEIRAVIDWLQRRPFPPRTAERAIILIKRLDAEIERLYKTLSEVQREQYMNGWNDGIKMFAKRLKKRMRQYSLDGKDIFEAIEDIDIDNLVEEMTEGKNG